MCRMNCANGQLCVETVGKIKPYEICTCKEDRRKEKNILNELARKKLNKKKFSWEIPGKLVVLTALLFMYVAGRGLKERSALSRGSREKPHEQ